MEREGWGVANNVVQFSLGKKVDGKVTTDMHNAYSGQAVEDVCAGW